VVVPLLELELHITREELEELARPLLDQTVQVTRDLLRWADLAEGRLAGVFLVGGASRIPLVATLLHRALGEAPVAIEQPELVVAEGSILADAALLATEPAAPGPTAEMQLLSRQKRPPAPPTAVQDPVPSAPLTPLPPPAPAPAGPVSQSSAPPSRSRPSVDDMETVPSSRNELLPPPAVDPWPDAQQHWVPDPDQTVASEPSWDLHALPKTPPPTAANAETRPARRFKTPTGPVSPSTSGSAVAGAAPTRQAPSASGSASARRAPAGSRPGAVASRPVPPARPAATTRPGRTSHWDAPPAPVQAQPKRRRRHPLVRLIRFLLSLCILVAVPVAAMVAAYSVIAGVPMDEAVGFILDEVRKLLERV
jgi:hypothetical protein